MVRFWDTSAVIPLVVEERSSRAVRSEYARDPELLVWWGTTVECVSALARLERDGILSESDVSVAFARLDAVMAGCREILPAESIRRTATRLLRVHHLRAADALQLAAAVVAAEGRPDKLPLVTRDERLRTAASREGFPVVLPGVV